MSRGSTRERRIRAHRGSSPQPARPASCPSPQLLFPLLHPARPASCPSPHQLDSLLFPLLHPDLWGASEAEGSAGCRGAWEGRGSRTPDRGIGCVWVSTCACVHTAFNRYTACCAMHLTALPHGPPRPLLTPCRPPSMSSSRHTSSPVSRFLIQVYERHTCWRGGW